MRKKINKPILVLIIAILVNLVFLNVTYTQRPGRFGQLPFAPGGGGFGPRFEQENILEKFDADKDGKLNDEERQNARKYIRDRFPNMQRQSQRQTTSQTKNIIQIEKTFSYDTKADLYDEKVLRTLYLQFPNDDWFDELTDFYRTEIEVPADLIVDGVTYPSVGVSFRGNTSYMMGSVKKPFNISVDYGDRNQRLYGYKTLNLLNSNEDPSLIREVLYSRICRDYMPAPKANFVRLVINGEYWGLYANVQQFNKDFLQDWFGTRGGVRWKVPANFSGMGALVWNGTDPEQYKNNYQLKTTNAPNAWKDLIKLCEVLKKTPNDQLESALSPIFDIDSALWFIAVDNIFMDDDGYISRGSDYDLYQDPDGRFHMIPYDNNETFRYGGFGPGSREASQQMRSPVTGEKDEMRPVISRLLSIPSLRARYLAHVRTIINEWLDWNVMSPVIEEYQALIDASVKSDDKKQFSYEAFASSATKDQEGGGFGPPGGGFRPPDDFRPFNNFGPPPDGFQPPMDGFGPPPDGFEPPQDRFNANFPQGNPDDRRGGPRGGGSGRVIPAFKNFVDQRREFLLKYPEIDKPVPVIKSVELNKNGSYLATESAIVKAQAIGNIGSVILYYSIGSKKPFQRIMMAKSNDEGTYIGKIPPCPAGSTVYYYIEARSVDSIGTTVFAPQRAEFVTFSYQVVMPVTKGFPVVINEVMPANTSSIKNPQGNYADWIELFNSSDKEVDLSGMYLSKKANKLTKWMFPKNTIISPHGYLIIWADNDSKANQGLHANFKLSRSGGEVMLVDRDDRENAVLDIIKYDKQEEDTSFGRFPDGNGELMKLTMTPGKKNTQ